MAMNKKEKAHLRAIESELKLQRAFRLTEQVEQDLPPPTNSALSENLTKGWSFNAYNCSVFKTCSSSIFHGRGWEKTNTQAPISQFSTKKLAKAALRYEVERECMFKLLSIDEIED